MIRRLGLPILSHSEANLPCDIPLLDWTWSLKFSSEVFCGIGLGVAWKSQLFLLLLRGGMCWSGYRCWVLRPGSLVLVGMLHCGCWLRFHFGSNINWYINCSVYIFWCIWILLYFLIRIYLACLMLCTLISGAWLVPNTIFDSMFEIKSFYLVAYFIDRGFIAL